MYKIQLNTSVLKEVEALEDFIMGRLDDKEIVDFDGWELLTKDVKVFNKTQKFLFAKKINHTSIVSF